MKKILLGLTAVLLTTATITAQTKTTTKAPTKSGLYVQLHGGYGLATGGTDASERTATGSGFSTVNTDTYKRVGYGQGFNTGLTVGTAIADNVAVELTGNYFMGSKQKIATSTNSSGSVKDEYSLKMIHIIPSLVLKTNNKDGANLYAKFGPSIGVGGKFKQVTTGVFGASTTEEITQLSKGISIGIQSAIGIDIPVSDKLSFVAEFSFRNQNFSPKKGEITSLTLNGVDRLKTVYPDVIDREFDFVKEVKSTTSPDPNKPDQVLKSSTSLSAAGLNIGLRFNF
jgi:outer membrane protein W